MVTDKIYTIEVEFMINALRRTGDCRFRLENPICATGWHIFVASKSRRNHLKNVKILSLADNREVRCGKGTELHYPERKHALHWINVKCTRCTSPWLLNNSPVTSRWKTLILGNLASLRLGRVVGMRGEKAFWSVEIPRWNQYWKEFRHMLPVWMPPFWSRNNTILESPDDYLCHRWNGHDRLHRGLNIHSHSYRN